MIAVGDAVKGRVVVVQHLWIVFEDEVVEDIVDAQLQFVFLEEGKHFLYGQSLLDVLFGTPQKLQNGFPGDEVLRLIGSQQLLSVGVEERVNPARVRDDPLA